MSTRLTTDPLGRAMSDQILTIEPKPTPAKKPAPSRRPRLPTGISYHPTPSGLKYRIRIRSAKKLQALGAEKAIDEIFDDLKQAEQRLLKLKYKKDDIQQEFYRKAIEEINKVKLEDLFEVHFDRYYSKLKSAKEHKSRMNVISQTIIRSEDPKLIRFAGTNFSMSELVKDEIPFGQIPVVDYKKYLQSFIDKRKEKVKNQTIVNDLMFIHTAIKNANVYFKDLPKVYRPLEDVDFKTLKDQVTYKDKRLKPETRAQIETILIEKSRLPHYANMFIFLSETGVRISEALSIQKNDCDLDKRIIFLVSKKNDKPRYIGITERLKAVITEQMKGKKQTDKLFPYSKETYQTKLKNIRPYLEQAGIKFNWHMLRHTFISNSIETKSLPKLMNEVDINNYQHFQEKYLNPRNAELSAIKVANAQQLTPDEIRTVAGHTDLQMTIGTYTHIRETTKEEQLAKENEELKRLLSLLAKKLEKD